MWRRLLEAAVIVALLLMCFWLWRPPLTYGAPYVSCPGGYIAPEIGDCPDIPQNRGGKREPTPHGGGAGGGGLLGDLLDSIGLGGLGGLL